jgi:hypothetical protein
LTRGEFANISSTLSECKTLWQHRSFSATVLFISGIDSFADWLSLVLVNESRPAPLARVFFFDVPLSASGWLVFRLRLTARGAFFAAVAVDFEDAEASHADSLPQLLRGVLRNALVAAGDAPPLLGLPAFKSLAGPTASKSSVRSTGLSPIGTRAEIIVVAVVAAVAVVSSLL